MLKKIFKVYRVRGRDTLFIYMLRDPTGCVRLTYREGIRHIKINTQLCPVRVLHYDLHIFSAIEFTGWFLFKYV